MKTPEAISRTLTEIILGVDAALKSGAGSDVLDAEGLVPVHWSDIRAEPIALGEARERLFSLVRRASCLGDPWARNWLTEQALSVAHLLCWLEDPSMSYEQGVAGCLRLDPNPLPRTWFQAAQAKRDWALEQAGLPAGKVGYEAYLDLDGVSAKEVLATLQGWMDLLRERTLKRLPGLILPAQPIVVKAVQGVPFSAYCDYPGQQVWINTDLPYTRATLKHLAAHEAYPGHYAHMGHREALLRDRTMLPDSALVVTNSASSVLFEGIAELGLDFLDFRKDRFDKVAWAQHRLQWACTLEVAHGLATRRMALGEATQFLRETCFAGDAWIEGKLRFATHKLRSLFVYAYWWGGTVMGCWWNGVPANKQQTAITYLYNHMHSPTTLLAHWTGEPKD
ncbi:MAG: DUF885 domain-containing protein [Meiothermus sp.]|nr:DUF885 domain-containing protein [Meiothermus sp.]